MGFHKTHKTQIRQSRHWGGAREGEIRGSNSGEGEKRIGNKCEFVLRCSKVIAPPPSSPENLGQISKKSSRHPPPRAQARQARARQARAKQARTKQARARQARAKQARARQARARQARARQARARQARVRQARVRQARAKQARSRQARAKQARVIPHLLHFIPFSKKMMCVCEERREPPPPVQPPSAFGYFCQKPELRLCDSQFTASVTA